MIVRYMRGNRGKPDSYWMLDDRDGLLAKFDTLADAALALRYMIGGNLTEAEVERAAAILANK